MTRTATWLITGKASLALVIVMLLVALLSATTNASFKDATAALAFVSAAAVGIECIIETAWTVLGGIIGTYWPLNAVGKQVNALVDELSAALEPFQATLQIPADHLSHPHLNVILTGLIIGLGSNPTHDVIRAIQGSPLSFPGDDLPTSDRS
ncbi:MAG: hypothetical protein H0X37_02350 [Herpetosiphonaceae bacterium]|nr:hypothetical protein [Herpetosiphonaceae bacterium]